MIERNKKRYPLQVECVWKSSAQLGEGPVWSHKQRLLFWLDIKSKQVFRFHVDTGKQNCQNVESLISCLALRRTGGLIAATPQGVGVLNWSKGTVTIKSKYSEEPAGNRPNDGKCDSMGRFWIGSMDNDESKATGKLYRIFGDGRVVAVLDGVVICNGIGWSPDNLTFYFTDSVNRKIMAFDHEPESGFLQNRRVFAQIKKEHGYPDGLAVDIEGGVWSAHWDGWRVTRYTPDGAVDRIIEMPVPRPTSCAFGGSDLLDLYITSASIGLNKQQLAQAPLSGSLFRHRPGIVGLEVGEYSG
ncbi:MAG: SMP-30/gluconolactonase/LRE family protein [Magnetococcales bacterium]|nr:SMP-30/gluconolactonase/LRE family protein [Magnetococcales bacterium]